VNGSLLGGCGLIAWPERYGSSGIQTFVVDAGGNVYQKDLGAQTAAAVAAIRSYNPDKSWTLTGDASDEE
jgi:hypothetical protein